MVLGDILTAQNSLDVRSCAKLDGVDDYFITDEVISFAGSRKGSISVWFKVIGNPATFDVILKHTNTGNNGNFTVLIRDTGVLNFRAYAPTSSNYYYINSNDDLRDNTWHHMVVTFNNNTIKMYIDNVDQGAQANTGSPTNINYLPNPLASGATIEGDDNFMNMYVRDIKIYNKDLSASEVNRLYNNSNVTDGLIHEYKLKEDGNDTVGSKNGTVTGAVFVNDESNIADAIRTLRVSGNDTWTMSGVGNQQVIVTRVDGGLS